MFNKFAPIMDEFVEEHRRQPFTTAAASTSRREPDTPRPNGMPKRPPWADDEDNDSLPDEALALVEQEEVGGCEAVAEARLDLCAQLVGGHLLAWLRQE